MEAVELYVGGNMFGGAQTVASDSIVSVCDIRLSLYLENCYDGLQQNLLRTHIEEISRKIR